MSEQFTVKKTGAIAGSVLLIAGLFTYFVASPRDVSDIKRQLAVVESRASVYESRASVDHDLLVRMNAQLESLSQRLDELKIQIRNK